MKKRILSVVCALAIVVGMIIPWTGDVHAAETTTCKCGATVTEWITLTDSTQMEAGKHYRLAWDVDRKTIGLYNKTDAAAATYCLDLAGYTLQGNSRMIVMNNSSDSQGALTLNIMDSSIEQTGKMMSPGVSDVYNGGAIYLYPNATVNLYGGTITTTDTSVVSASSGGVISLWATATLNMFGGKIIGGTSTTDGGAISLSGNSTFNMSGGSVVGGTAPKGNCIYAATGAKINLSRSAKIEELYFENAAAASSGLTVSGTYAGKTVLNFATMPADGDTIGTGSNASIGTENIVMLNPRMSGQMSGNNLVARVLTGVTLKPKGSKAVYYSTLSAAAKDAQDGGVIKLLGNNSENVTIAGNVTLDLNGWNLTGNINATGTLKLKDCATDDLVANDAIGVGVVTGTITGDVQCASNYAAVKVETGTTYHKYILKLTKVSLRPGVAGMYYTADIQMDEVLREKLDQFGIAVSVYDAEPSLESANTKYTAFGKDAYGSSAAKSALITEFMDKNGSAQDNTTNAQTDVYGRPYFQYTDDGTTYCLYGYTYATNLQALTEQIENSNWSALKLDQNRAISGMYAEYENTLKTWNLPTLKQAAADKKAADDDNILKVLVIGNSHGLDSVQLLVDVFNTEGFEGYDDVVVGAMYIGGCQVYQHVNQIKGNLPYSYYNKHGGKNGSWVRRNDTTLLYALEDENWDVVLLQEMNRVSAIPDTDTEGRFAFGNDDIETVYNYVVQNLGYVPYLMWNMIWTNPEIPEDYLQVVLNAESGDDTYVDPEYNPGDGSNLSYEDWAALQTWGFGGGEAPLSSHVSWSQQYSKYWNNDSLKMYEATVENVEKYVLGKSELGITVDDVMPAATAVQYALDRCGMPENGKLAMGGTDKAMYRDYTHMSDYGRLMVAYLWHAKLTGKTQITEVNYTNVPESMRQTKGYGNLVLDQEQIDAIIDSVNFALANPLAGDELMTLN